MGKTKILMNYSAKTVALATILCMICIAWAGTVYSACIQVTAPNGGEVLIPGSPKTISWTYDNTGGPGNLVKIELFKGGLLNAAISTSTTIGSNGNGSYNWTVPAQQAGGTDYSIRVTSKTKPTCTDTSDSNFNIYGLKITSPNGGENWVQASKNIISWDSPGWPPGEKVRLELWQGGNLIGTCFDNLSAGLVLWFVGSMGPVNQNTWAPPGSGYKIKIVSLTTNLSDMSDGTFTIAPPTIHLTSPNGGESWTFGTTKQITWTSSGIRSLELVRLDLLKGGNLIGSLSSVYSYEPQNSWNWIVGHKGGPFAPLGNDYKVRITTTMSNISDESDGFFTITPATIRLTAPNGGEVWSKLSIKQITWTSEGCSDSSTIRLDLLPGTTGCNIANQIPTKQGSYSWTTGKCANGSTVSTASNYKIKITAEGGCGPSDVMDTSDGTFRISYP
jgi:hypothetical protein